MAVPQVEEELLHLARAAELEVPVPQKPEQVLEKGFPDGQCLGGLQTVLAVQHPVVKRPLQIVGWKSCGRLDCRKGGILTAADRWRIPDSKRCMKHKCPQKPEF
jgi:hypothetical protein